VNYTNWHKGEPNHSNYGADYVQMYADGTWNDRKSKCNSNYVCSKSTTPPESNYVEFVVNGRTFRHVRDKVSSWTDARNA